MGANHCTGQKDYPTRKQDISHLPKWHSGNSDKTCIGDYDYRYIYDDIKKIDLGTHEIVTCSAKIKDGHVLSCPDGRKNVYMVSDHRFRLCGESQPVKIGVGHPDIRSGGKGTGKIRICRTICIDAKI